MEKIKRFQAAKLYAITASPAQGASQYPDMVRAACIGGADIIQFRDQQLSIRERYEMALELAEICYDAGALFIVNDMIDLALAAGADGVHLGQDDLPMDVARELVNRFGAKEFLIGRSTHSLEEALEAEQSGADYIAIGPVFETPTKPTYKPVGLELVREVTARVKTLHVVIGGINASNISSVIEAGAQRIAAVRAICGATDVSSAARAFKEALKGQPVA